MARTGACGTWRALGPDPSYLSYFAVLLHAPPGRNTTVLLGDCSRVRSGYGCCERQVSRSNQLACLQSYPLDLFAGVKPLRVPG